MRVMTGQTGESSVAVAKTGGAVQIGGLVTNVPAICPVCLIFEIACLAMAGSAEAIEFCRRQSLRILDGSGRSKLFHVDRAGSVA